MNPFCTVYVRVLSFNGLLKNSPEKQTRKEDPKKWELREPTWPPQAGLSIKWEGMVRK